MGSGLGVDEVLGLWNLRQGLGEGGVDASQSGILGSKSG